MAEEAFPDIPFFRELQKLLASGQGPLNMEIARQVATAVATQGLSDMDPPPEMERTFADAVATAERLSAGYSRLPQAEPFSTDTIGKGRWVGRTLSGWRWLLEHTANRFTAEMSQTPERGEGDQMRAALEQVSPLLMGLQAGTMIGNLAGEAIGRYDFPIARDDDGKLFLVWPNVEAVAEAYAFDRDAFVRWLALRDTARHLVAVGVPWFGRYHRSLLTEVVDAIEVDVSDIERRLAELQESGLQAMQEGVGVETVIPISSTPRHQKALDRIRAFTTLFEGYSEHISEVVGAELVDGVNARKIDEGLARRAISKSEGRKLLETVFGLMLDRDVEAAGATFCAAVVKLKGLPSLNRVWDAPDNLPNLAEIKDPFAWMERVLDD